MKPSVTLICPLLLATSVACVEADFDESGTLDDGTTTVRVSGGGDLPVEFVVNFESVPTPASDDPGCGVEMSSATARRLGGAYSSVASDDGEAFERVVGLDDDGEITITRGLANTPIESVIDDGNNVTNVPVSCLVTMTNDDAWMVGGWLQDAGTPAFLRK